MTAEILDGKLIAKQERENLAKILQQRKSKGQRAPGLAVILVGEDPASQIYVQSKRAACAEVGIYSKTYHFAIDVTAEELFNKIDELNHTSQIDGILVQLPLPPHIPTDRILESIHPHKDVDGFHAFNMGKLAQNQPALRPCTPSGIITLIQHTPLQLSGCQACVVGASRIVGRPMALELLNHDATVTLCHKYTRDLKSQLLQADLIVVAIGQPQFIQGAWIKPGAVVIDVGTNRSTDGKLLGDVDFEQAKQTASWITPVPGGVGPMTVCTLLKNTLIAAEKAI